MADFSSMMEYFPEFWEGFLMTAEVSIYSIMGSFILGTIVALMRVSGQFFMDRLARIYIDLFRNIPFIVLVFFGFYGLPEVGVYIDAFWTGVLVLSFAVGAYVAETLRAGIMNIDKGIIEAAQSFGFSKIKVYRKIILPIALTTSVRPLGSVFINLILTTSILSTITLNELTSVSKIIASETFRPFEVYVFIVFFYGVLTFILSGLITKWHVRLNRFASEGA
ncbi:amino acid ABC transporter permease [Pseudemcibacter aquimaris]|uniref:amino acid ABC transporter permease n=1 Tax=Pseudemcibacter aquimaris TaxID=2857064 RepID=UPI002011DB5B|nr:amino acid ABC transporter permease [Pseudemcibacter aquimaris]MCC3860771.1 amino acid ABC transporter permease [Pseudemcibacter aquimaris]WDU59589.1 amino acid ABC transporter permease [Pseudemcibacter aquimaris]